MQHLLSGWRGIHTTQGFNKKESANELARLLFANQWHSTKFHVYTRYQQPYASKFKLPFEFDKNMAARFHSRGQRKCRISALHRHSSTSPMCSQSARLPTPLRCCGST